MVNGQRIMFNVVKRSIHFLEYLYCHLLIVFLLGRVGFILYNRGVERLSLLDAASACWRGFVGHDLMVCAMLLALPWLLTLLMMKMGRGRLGVWLAPYYVLMGVAVAAIIVADSVMYEYWQFKLGTVMLSYAASPEGATNSVSPGYILVRVCWFVSLALWIAVPCVWLTPRRFPSDREARLWMRNISLIWTFLIVSGVCFMRQGDVYGSKHHPTQLADHAAVNPVLAFAESIRWTNDFGARHNYLSEADRQDMVQGLYPAPSDDICDTLLTTARPDILVVFMESFGSRFVEEQGGLPDVAPGWSRLIPEGIFWQNYYSNSFRTDRGTVSAFCGWLSYTDVGLMRHTELHPKLPSIAVSLQREGYATGFMYGGAMTNMGKGEFLKNMKFSLSPFDVSSEDEDIMGSWGIRDGEMCRRAVQEVARWQEGRHFMVLQTLSSHEPWDVPYHRLGDTVLNAFAYTDQCVASMIDSLRRLPQWDNLLVVMLPDHGYLYQQSYKDPGFFRSPMLWTGGAVRSPRRMDVLMNQSDLAATLLSQMGIRHDEFPWSRNVLSKDYVYPFVYCNWPAGVLFADSTGVSIYDTAGDAVLLDEPSDGGLRLLRAKAILQTSYDQLSAMERQPATPN